MLAAAVGRILFRQIVRSPAMPGRLPCLVSLPAGSPGLAQRLALLAGRRFWWWRLGPARDGASKRTSASPDCGSDGPGVEANHVWLILVVLLFTCFPPVFSRLAVVLHIPLTLMLIGIVLRGSAFRLEL